MVNIGNPSGEADGSENENEHNGNANFSDILAKERQKISTNIILLRI